MTYNVFGGTLNLAQSITHTHTPTDYKQCLLVSVQLIMKCNN